jgi:16S rRNA (guanine527-N7)-methyltransferase
MDPARIAELLKPFLADGVSESQVHAISIYMDMLLRWNERVNLTAVRKPEEIVTRHFGESLFTARQLFPGNRKSLNRTPTRDKQRRVGTDLIDLGSGAGFPGLPVKIWNPDLWIILIESNQKRATFLREVIRALKLTNIDVFAERAESFLDQANVVTLRAVERFEQAVSVALRLVAPGGTLALLIGRTQLATVYQLTTSIKWSEPVAIPLSSHRMLLVGNVDPEKQES